LRWVAKAATFKVLSAIPYGHVGYRLIQDRITHTTDVTEGKVEQRIGFGLDCLDAIAAHGPARPLSDLRVIDVGAGWMPTVPLLLYGAGVGEQVLFDIIRHLQIERLAAGVDIFRRLLPEDAAAAGHWQRLPPAVDPADTVDTYLRRVGMSYVAPYGLDDLVRQPGAHVATCTSVLHHLHPSVLRPLLAAIFESLADGGLLLAHTPLHDPYALFDRRITPYNKWRYSDFVWERLVNSSLMSFNRLTAGDYRRLLEEAGFEVVQFDTPPPTAAEVEALEQVRLHPRFRSRPKDELTASDFFVVARRS
jgi:Methyltransferase domain